MRGFVGAASACALALALAGCSGGESTQGAPLGAAASPAIGADASLRTVTAWAKAYNGGGNSRRDAVTGALAAAVRAGGGPSGDVELRDPVFYVPRLAGYPRWFAAAAPAGKKQALAVFVQDKAGDAWRAAHWIETAGRLPEPSFDAQGYAVAADDRALPTAHADYLASGDQSALVPDAASARARAAKVGGWKAEPGRFSPGPGASYALRTKDGGALVWYGLTQQQTLTGGDRGDLPADVRARLDERGASPDGKVRTSRQWLVLGTAPLEGRSRVLDESVALTDAY
ncbi:hypothetical protein [Actinomadura parmotrematis]|uniref:DUF8094 domain-containing protein n=1 Tax=Actinomadura parmotrematis TaxID=2864039 RepID=A0ABS7G4U1_9ACTN|nr:hypothetical protein [Actinomadura parmotrematis]MBW8487546.1 hypothetical protein [Actinomadura parmotrematis]